MPGRILVDTSAWIEFFRKKDSKISLMVREALNLNQACYAGPIAVELFQGAKTNKEVEIINQLLESIHYVEITRWHYYHAGEISYKAARSGKSFSIVDLILAVLAHDEQLTLLSLDTHFKEISRFCPLSFAYPL